MLRVIGLVTIMLAVGGKNCEAQSYRDSMLQWQRHYKQEFLSDARSPVKAEDTGYIRFFEVSRQWRVVAGVRLTPETKPFDMATHSGKSKKFRQWAVLSFNNPVTRGWTRHTLSAYERVDRPESDTASRLTLFIPFNDETNNGETYGGGRYMDIPKADVKNGFVVLDFNKAYNPYCAFGEGFSCPIPPQENRLDKDVRAGEMVWAKEVVEH